MADTPEDDGTSELESKLSLPSIRRRRRKASVEATAPADDPAPTIDTVEAEPQTETANRPEPQAETASRPEPPADIVSPAEPQTETPSRDEPLAVAGPETATEIGTGTEPPVGLSEAAEEAREDEEQRQPRPRRRIRVPHLPTPLATALAGIVGGLVLVGVVAAFLRVCAASRGTDTCGSTGFWYYLVGLLAAIAVGAVLLRLLSATQPFATSVLAVGLLAVVAMLFLLPSLSSTWMVLVVPLLSLLTFVLAGWLTTSFTGPDNAGVDPGRLD